MVRIDWTPIQIHEYETSNPIINEEPKQQENRSKMSENGEMGEL
jgi:hypothetical protein